VCEREDPGHGRWVPIFDCGRCRSETLLTSVSVAPDGSLVCPACSEGNESLVWCPECRTTMDEITYWPDGESGFDPPGSCHECRTKPEPGKPGHYPRQCEYCERAFIGKRSTARFCSGSCRTYAWYGYPPPTKTCP
jgi:hypothetical protein